MKKLFLIVALMGSALMGQSGPLANGVYAVAEGTPKAKKEVVRQHEGKDVALETANFAPLVAGAKAEVQRDSHGSSLMIQLAPEAAKRLEALTRSQLNRRVAVVIGDKIVSAPMVRSVIEDGKARVTPCEDEGCNALLRQLSK